MNIKNKTNKKNMKIIITVMLVLIFQIGELLSPFTTLVKASAYNYITVIVRENSYTGPVIEGATVNVPATGDTKITDSNGKCIVLDHNGNGWKSTITASKDGYEDGQKERTVNGSLNHNTTTIVLKRKNTNVNITAQKPQFTVTMDSYIPTNPSVGEEITFSGTIHPQDFVIPKSLTLKEVVLVLDSSGSMADSSKLISLKAAARNFITKMKDVRNLKIGIVDFDTQANINNKLINSSDVTALNSSIDRLFAEGGTNTGEGLRQAVYLLSSSPEQNSTANKTIVFMSDGEPTFYNWQTVQRGWKYDDYSGKYYKYYGKGNTLLYNSDLNSDNMIDQSEYRYKLGPYEGEYYGWKYQNGQDGYYTDTTKSSRDSSVSVQGTGYSDADSYCLNYAKTIGAIIKEKGYNVFSIGYGLDSSGTIKMQQIHNSMSTVSSNFIQSGTNSIDSIFNSIGNEISDSYPITDVKFNFNSGANTDIESVNGNVIDLPDFNYVKVDETSDTIKYSAEPVPFTVKVKSNITGTNIPVFTNSTVTFPWKSEMITANVPIQYINVLAAGISQVKMEVSDSSGTINKKYDSIINGLNYNVNNNGEVYKLYGKSNVAIDVVDTQATHLKYRFIKDGQQPSEEDWEYMALNGDVDNEKPGNLTQMPYDVSHMPLLNNTVMWSNRNEVYKTPFADKTGIINTNITSANQYYVTSETVVNKDGNMITRWVPKTLFVENQYVEGYAHGYKEARKTWGYIKVNQTGNYYFKAYSDDGFYGTITVNGELKVLGDAFSPRSVGDAGLDATNAITLEAGKYYPIYLEYFNWGGSAAFKIMCSLNNQYNYQLIGSSSSNTTLYPSKSDSPTKSGNNVFMGAKNINFKTEPGIYTIQYALLKEKNTGTTTQKEYDEISRGSFGKFEVEERFNGLSKTFSKNPIQKGEEFYINYNLTPKPIKLTDLYKGNTIPATLSPIYVNNLILTDTLPDGLVNVENNNSKSVNKVLDKIEYNYNSQTGNYEASQYTFSVKVKTDLNVDNVSFNTSGQIDYRDVSLKDDSRISQTQYFSDIPVLNFFGNSEITKHGVFSVNTVIDSSAPVNVINSMNYTFGFTIDVKGTVNKFTLMSIPNNVTIDRNNICVYKLDEDQKTILSSKKVINNSNVTKNDNVITVSLLDNSQSILSIGEKYAVVYSVSRVEGDATLTAQLDTGSQKNLQLKNGSLPDLF